MSMAVLSCEFLISPATCPANEVEAQVISLVEAVKCLDEGIDPPVLEPDALGRLIAAGTYPAEGLFKANLTKCQIETYSSKDVAKIVNALISKANDIFDVTEPREIEWKKKSVSPALVNTWPNRAKELEELFTQIAVQCELEGKAACVVHHCGGNPGPQFLFSGELSDAYPTPQIALPHLLSSTVQTHPTFQEYLATLDHHDLFARATDDFHLKLSFYVGALRKAKSQGLSPRDISLDNFDLGPEFSNSMEKNQCGPGGTFAGVLVDTISDLLAGHPKNPVSIFRKSAMSDEAKTHGTFTGYRTHVTKSGVALRLMFWRNDDGMLVLANVGPKQELVIEKP
ncbi:hypothetical protein [Cupriavidus taiwanensis]|uniref:Uncharacterized protein n=1 Tax=Cupriavidus taiwanensis TaxID=164546 RepID=A0A7Z7NNH2_9BURK|nr:hypothetical protein [Cupriavidus taiwanensis]SOZ09530.1 conserved protein of unknown function [Cupriavidus taiwanensis]SOZ11653.1 conserved protein of unknown function [Cupriavidus taiwanensis]SOZ43008.1 conserved protein of unknown function [Cupriavidus taiwanensis]SPC22255.1 conserved protein of unknown function [Cupriavidus taiwanensis]SPD53757.1 conserved protein of unknown function [Cupriavidus taiwanensis]